MDGTDGNQLWKSDGTAAGTAMVTAFPLGSFSDTVLNLSSLVGDDGALFFEGGSPVAGPGYTVYRSDGTPAGTSAIFTPDSSTVGMSGLTVSGSSLYFLTSQSGDNGSATDLWKSDGTSGGTTLVASIPNAYAYGNSVGPLTDVNGKVFFAVDQNSPSGSGDQFQLWASDGTASGTSEVTSLSGALQGAAALGNELVFTQSDANGTGESLWVSDGTDKGTVQLQDFARIGSGYGYYPYGSSSNYVNPLRRPCLLRGPERHGIAALGNRRYGRGNSPAANGQRWI